jgi:hypothetical protein
MRKSDVEKLAKLFEGMCEIHTLLENENPEAPDNHWSARLFTELDTALVGVSNVLSYMQIMVQQGDISDD